MKLTDAKAQFISSWGAFGTHWGINRTMAQIHALLLISPDPITQDDIMEQLSISRGNVNMNTRDLIGWGLGVDTWRTKRILHRRKRHLESCHTNYKRKKKTGTGSNA
jgi:DNA-binding transcriptional regulator GbsR (MarR family)